ncbi:hypothetical protein AB0M43_38880 [Longispora sp. NPDC051575]|uniref:hypothetical protein n=1 Tax=Longispora sp. NPDC051575 TaxID=3154943 RepID=UPI0034153FB4
MRFSEHYNVMPSQADDWFDTFLPADTKLAVDPFLIYEDTESHWETSHGRILSFFALLFELVAKSGGSEDSMYWKQAKGLLLFPEPAEFCLGVSEGTPLGLGSGPDLQAGMLEGIRTAVGLGYENISHMETLALFQGGMGLDRISDAVCNILKSYFIEYTQQVCARHSIPVEEFQLAHASWSEEYARWSDRKVKLPLNPYVTKRRIPVLLVPERFLRDIPVVTANGFWSFAWSSHGEKLRGDFNFDIARNVSRTTKARMARQNPDVVADYLSLLEGEAHDSYDIYRDPKLLVNWYEAGAGLSQKKGLSFVPEGPHEFAAFVRELVRSFKHSVEQGQGWVLLWANNRGVAERAVQALFRSVTIHYCRAHGISLSGEANAGRGPVDFKFSKGWDASALVEIKLMRNTHFWDGILAQTPTYAVAEEVEHAIVVAIAYTDADMKASRLANVERAAEIASEISGISVVSEVVDARQKTPGSKLKADPEARRRALAGEDPGDLSVADDEQPDDDEEDED